MKNFNGKSAWVSALALAAAFAFASAAAAGTADCRDIATDKGKVTGVLDAKSGVCSYKGIPFAAPPVGELRFARPREHAPWTETLQATKFGNECIQNPLSLTPSKNIVGNEDCLYMNIWHPADGADGPKPVMVFIHGGGFIYGSGQWPIYDGTNLAGRGGVMVVNFNYRLGPFGFLALPAFKDSEGYMGNFGLFDQIAVLNWVKKNISNFGGDPDNVTIFGESAGGISVDLLLVSPLARGLFHKAIIESGPVNLLIGQGEKFMKYEEKMVGILGCSDADSAKVASCLRALNPKTIMEKITPGIGFLSGAEGQGSFSFDPYVDGKLIPDDPYLLFKEGKYDKSIPVIIGSNTDEASFFTASRDLNTIEDYKRNLENDCKSISESFGINVDAQEVTAHFPVEKYENPRKAYNAIIRELAFTCPSRALARTLSEAGANVYLYVFGKSPDERGLLSDWGAFHGSELAFVHHNFEFMGIKFFSKDNSTLSKKMLAYWAAFAKTGKPEVGGLPAWNPYDPKKENYLYLDLNIEERYKYQSAECDYIEPIIFGGK